MAKKDFKGDFMGFTFNGVHSSDLNIVRTSDGSRYNSDLLPSFNDNTVAVPGGDGTYYFGSYYNQKPFPIQFATDELDEAQFRQLRQWLGDKGIHDLIFDEAPYKKYSAKIAAVPNFNYICFDEGTNHRTYKGEGTIQFICYYPFARSVYKQLSQYDGYDTFTYFLTSDTEKQNGKTYYIKNENEEYVEFTGQTFVQGQEYYERERVPFEWAAASGIPATAPSTSGTSIALKNPGDLETDINIITTATSGLSFSLNGNIELSLNDITLEDGDSKIRINSSTHLIEGLNSNNVPTGNLYNKYISSGDFFKVPLGDSTLTGPSMTVEYDYLYY